jgi:protein arginine kinase
VTGIEGMVRQAAVWLDGSGADSETVLTTRVRLARNIASIPFIARAREDQLNVVMKSASAAAEKTDELTGYSVLRMADLSDMDRRFLVERHLISPDFSNQSPNRGILINGNETASIVVNEEDHLRIQILCSGSQISKAWERADLLDSQLERNLEYVFSPDLGYLTSCPTNVGTGLRASVLVHLPALVLTKQIRKVIQGVAQVGLAVRGFYGEGTEVVGNFFQISNQITLGQSEQETLAGLERVLQQVLGHEEKARGLLLKDASVQVEDKVWRAYGTLANCRVVSSQEIVNLTSAVRLGVALGFKGLPALGVLNEILVLTQPAHIQMSAGRDMEPTERNAERARQVRKRLGLGSPKG